MTDKRDRVFAASRTLEVWAMGQSVLPASQQVQFQAMAAWADLDANAPREGRKHAVITIEMTYDPEPEPKTPTELDWNGPLDEAGIPMFVRPRLEASS